MATLIDAVRRLHGPELAPVDGSYDMDVICPECTRLRVDALSSWDPSGEALGVTQQQVRVKFPCETTLASGPSREDCDAQAQQLRFAHFEERGQALRDELGYIETVLSMRAKDAQKAEPPADEAEEKPAAKKPARKTPAKKAQPKEDPKPEAAEPAVEAEQQPEPEAQPEPAPAVSEDETATVTVNGEKVDDDWDF